MATSQRNLVTLAEAAEHLRVSTKTLRRAIAAGKYKAYRAGVGTRSPFLLDLNEIDRDLEPIPTTRRIGA